MLKVATDLVADDRDLGDVLYKVGDFEAASVEEPQRPESDEAIDIPSDVDLSRLDGPFKRLIEKGPPPCSVAGGSKVIRRSRTKNR